ncbi:MAG: hypothetical protein K2X90_03725 [Candidatus Babeliaceae bacterium]|nr:hypothetical protein [Candidatus Babeliaceae bacterium]
MFLLHQKVVYPGYGVAYVKRIIEKQIGADSAAFYELTFLNKDMTILVPVSNIESIGLRSLSSANDIHAIFNNLSKPERKLSPFEFSASSWNKRHKEYQLKLRRGTLEDLSAIYKDLRTIEAQKKLSFGEKTILQKTEGLLVEEITVVQNAEAEKTVQKLRTLCSSSSNQH